ncbi:hypothetical protein SAMN02746041_01913 [Desulfacinum hydrothermale DSM 13146]|uniref:Uncharacterized protein n=1 Tax=Desulfacinum hydrothermale DSM 13146 TaxID=1121390 RepID=A0A1W1XJ76_9BACT|nr:hypothetical protein [Desulfacinum hydrothermale]SMC24019.1 hypothetical protein SAMN02746041_01913 [Desulfacinum hydrothermale DSM 13146]
MGIGRLLAIGTQRGMDLLERVATLLEKASPAVLALDENPIWFSTLIHMRTSGELLTEQFLLEQKEHVLRRGGDVGKLGALLYALRHPGLPLHFVDGIFGEVLSETGDLVGVYPYVGDVDFAVSTDMMNTPIQLIKERIPRYPGVNFDYELIHAFQVEATDEAKDRALGARNAFTAQVLNRLLDEKEGETLAFVGHRKRFLKDAFEKTPGLTAEERSAYEPLFDLVKAEQKQFWDSSAAEQPGPGRNGL